MRPSLRFTLAVFCVACGGLMAVAIGSLSRKELVPAEGSGVPFSVTATRLATAPDTSSANKIPGGDQQATGDLQILEHAPATKAVGRSPAGEPRVGGERIAAAPSNIKMATTATALAAGGSLVPYPPYARQIDPSAGSPASLPSLTSLIEMIRNSQAAQPNAAAGQMPSPPAAVQPQSDSLPTSTPPTRPASSSIERVGGDGSGNDKLMINIQDENIRSVLEAFSAQGDLNILASPSVQGTVSAVLSNVDIETALDAILKSTGYISRHEGDFIYVGSPEDFQKLDQTIDEIGTRMYRPNYVAAAELQNLIEPLLTPGLGKISVTTPSETGIATDADQAGGDSFAAGETLIVQDYKSVLQQIDQIVDEIDQRPLQVAIEAMILNVRLDDEFKFGIDWEVLRNRNAVRLAFGSPQSSLPTSGSSTTSTTTTSSSSSTQLGAGGLTFAYLDSTLGSFLDALETVGDANVIATPRLMCLNKQRAEILIGAELGYISTTVTSTSSSQSVEFLKVGTQLRLRPFISSDGNIRMEVHPELSTGQVRVEGGFTLPDKDVTSVTTNVMVRDGGTLIIGGLVREDLQSNTSQFPLLGNLPAVGVLFRNKDEKVVRRELLVLITPHIVYEPQVCAEGEDAASEFHRRQAVYADHMSPISKRLMGRKYFQLARQAWFAGDLKSAKRYIHWSVHIDPLNRAAIDLQVRIESGEPPGDPSFEGQPFEPSPAQPLDGEEVAPWLLDALRHAEPTGGQPRPVHPRDPGVPGPHQDIVRPRKF